MRALAGCVIALGAACAGGTSANAHDAALERVDSSVVATVDAALVVDGHVAADAPVGLADAPVGPADAPLGPADAPLMVGDAPVIDAFRAPDAPLATGGCVSGATGARAVRFSWAGDGPGSTAYVVYDLNQLPDTSRWNVSAASMSIDYTPVFDDTFLGEGGLDLEEPAFIDVELSTVGLSVIRGVTIAIYGRSFATTTSGSFTWQTFDDTGATEPDSLANSAPYAWYLGDATSAFSAGDDGMLLRLRPGPSSDALIVNTVEVCFDAD